MMTKPLAVALLALFQFMSHAQDGAEPEKETVRVEQRTLEHGGVTYAWSIMIPESAEKGGAAILFLHGAGECGTDGKKNLAVGLPRYVRESPEDWPFVVIVPQKPNMDSEWEDHEEAIIKMLAIAREEGLFDPKRLAITGLSQGGHGTIMLAARHADMFRCAAPVCGYVDRRFDEEGKRLSESPATSEDASVKVVAAALKDMPVWLFHGELDNVVPPEESEALDQALVKVGAKVRYSALPDANHNAWDPAYSDAKLREWFEEHTR